jgi:hypothetical protein
MPMLDLKESGAPNVTVETSSILQTRGLRWPKMP